MKFFAFTKDGLRGLAVSADGKSYHGLTEDHANWPGSMDDILLSGTLTSAAEVLLCGEVVHADDVTPALLVERPGKVLCIGLNYAAHVKESNLDMPTVPTMFGRFASGLIPHKAPIVCPDVSKLLDYEGELAIVIGKKGRKISKEDALSHVAGYTIFNDGSIRDWQLATPQWTTGKNFDDTGALGPVLATPDEFSGGVEAERITTRLNGEVMQDSPLDDLIFNIPHLIEFLSTAMTLLPGDIIATGTPSGVGGARDPQVWLKPGDVVEVEVSGLGVLRNPVIGET